MPGHSSSAVQPPVFLTPGGREILYLNQREIGFVYNEIFTRRVYVQHGIAVQAGATVVDVGANIGLFTIFAQETFTDCRVIAIEPSPPVFSVLTANTAAYGEAVRCVPCGVSDIDAQAVLTHYPDYSIMSSFHSDAEQDSQTLRAAIRNEWSARFSGARPLDDRHLDLLVATILGKKQTYACELRPLSSILHEAGVRDVALLKIDAEGSENQVLSGIAEDQWPRIAQIVIEIHDAAGDRTGSIVNLLQRRGFDCHVEQEQLLRGSGIVNCYARRK